MKLLQLFFIFSVVCSSALAAFVEVANYDSPVSITSIGKDGNKCMAKYVMKSGGGTGERDYTQGMTSVGINDCTPLAISLTASNLWVVFQINKAAPILNANNANSGTSYQANPIQNDDDLVDGVLVVGTISTSTANNNQNWGKFLKGFYIASRNADDSAYGSLTYVDKKECSSSFALKVSTPNCFKLKDNMGTSSITGNDVYLTIKLSGGVIEASNSGADPCNRDANSRNFDYNAVCGGGGGGGGGGGQTVAEFTAARDGKCLSCLDPSASFSDPVYWCTDTNTCKSGNSPTCPSISSVKSCIADEIKTEHPACEIVNNLHATKTPKIVSLPLPADSYCIITLTGVTQRMKVKYAGAGAVYYPAIGDWDSSTLQASNTQLDTISHGRILEGSGTTELRVAIVNYDPSSSEIFTIEAEDPSVPDDDDGLSKRQVVGIVLGCFAFIVAIVAIVWGIKALRRYKAKRSEVAAEYKQAQTTPKTAVNTDIETQRAH